MSMKQNDEYFENQLEYDPTPSEDIVIGDKTPSVTSTNAPKSDSNTKDVQTLIKEVNAILLRGESTNISRDTYSGYTGYKPQYIIDAMNQIVGIGNWGFKELSSSIESVKMQTSEGLLALAQVSVWIKGISFEPVGWGQSRVTKGDLGDARKGAQTDAIKKALSYFSIGNRAFHGLLK